MYRGDTNVEIYRVLAGQTGSGPNGQASCGLVLNNNPDCLYQTGTSQSTANTCSATECTSNLCSRRTIPTTKCPAECLWFAYRNVTANTGVAGAPVYSFPTVAGVTKYYLQVNGACPSTVWDVTFGCAVANAG